jgi:hypothetical protein
LSSVVPSIGRGSAAPSFFIFRLLNRDSSQHCLSRSFVSDTAEFVELKFSTVLMATFSSMLQHVWCCQRREPGAFLFLCLHSFKPCHCFEFCGNTGFLWLNLFSCTEARRRHHASE